MRNIKKTVEWSFDGDIGSLPPVRAVLRRRRHSGPMIGAVHG
jgi:hypothetical protein